MPLNREEAIATQVALKKATLLRKGTQTIILCDMSCALMRLKLKCLPTIINATFEGIGGKLANLRMLYYL